MQKIDIKKIDVKKNALINALDYAQKSINFTYDRMKFGRDYLKRVKNIVKGLISELAFKDWLRGKDVNFRYKQTHFTETDKSDLHINSHRIDIKNFYVNKDSKLNNDISRASALVPVDQLESNNRMGQSDVYAFFAVFGHDEFNDSYKEKPLYSHIISRESLYKNYIVTEKELGDVEFRLKDSSESFNFNVCGQNSDGDTVIERMELNSENFVSTKNNFYSLLYLNSKEKPKSDVLYRIDNSTLGIANKDSWGDIKIYDAEVYFLGWMSKLNFKNEAEILPKGSSCLQYDKTYTDNYEVKPITRLNSPKTFIEYLTYRGGKND